MGTDSIDSQSQTKGNNKLGNKNHKEEHDGTCNVLWETLRGVVDRSGLPMNICDRK